MNNRDVALIGMDCPNLMGLGDLGITIPTINLPTAEPTFWQKLSNTFTKVETGIKTATPVVQQGKSLFDLFKSTRSNVLNPTTTNASTPPPPGDSGNNKTAMIALGVVAAGITLLAIKAHQGSKKKKALGDLNTAKSKSGKVKQRKAVFARMDEAGETFTKNKKGRRTKKK